MKGVEQALRVGGVDWIRFSLVVSGNLGTVGFGDKKCKNRLPESVYPSLSSLPSSSAGDSPGKISTAGRQGNPKVNSAPETSSKPN